MDDVFLRTIRQLRMLQFPGKVEIWLVDENKNNNRRRLAKAAYNIFISAPF